MNQPSTIETEILRRMVRDDIQLSERLLDINDLALSAQALSGAIEKLRQLSAIEKLRQLSAAVQSASQASEIKIIDV